MLKRYCTLLLLLLLIGAMILPCAVSCEVSDSTNSHLDGKYATFGYVIAGMGTVDSIASVSVGPTAKGEVSVPKETIVMERVCFVRNTKEA